MWRHRNQTIQPVQPWTWQRLLLSLATAGLLLIAALLGVALALAQTLWAGSWPAVSASSTSGHPTDPVPATVDAPGSSAVRDRIAAAPMASLPSEAATRPDPARTPAPPIRVPDAVNGRGPAGVPTFPHTYPGAVAQLAGKVRRSGLRSGVVAGEDRHVPERIDRAVSSASRESVPGLKATA